MEIKSIEFDMLKDVCKYNKEEEECQEDDNISGCCECAECPIWNDLVCSEMEL